jgi:glycosyltransferase involved in cell wall biosynthesis
MRVAIDGRSFDAPAGGVRRYVTELFGAMRTVAPEVELVSIGGEGDPIGLVRQHAASLLPTNLGWCLAGLPVGARRAGADVFHAPAYTAPLWGVHPLVVTIHDVSYARRPDWSPHPARVGAARQAFYRASARSADRILTDSAFSKSEIMAAYAIDADRIDVVPLGVGRQFRVDPATVREPFVLHVGDLHARRNLARLVDATLVLRRREARLASLRVVLVGRDLGVIDALRRQAADAGAPDALEYVGRTDDATLVRWYQRCGLLAYPSKYEGFGLPLLEAMAAGAPVVASSAASVPEVVGDAALVVPPDETAAWADAMGAVLLDPSRAADLSARGQRRASQFTWKRTAAETLDVYRRASGRR